MENFIYCIDENVKDSLIKSNFKFIQETQIDNQKVWVFLYDKNFLGELNKFDKKSFILTNRLNF
jgi:hypothetical protein